LRVSCARGFTFVELVIVVIILAVATGMAVPRLLSWKSRKGEQVVQAVADLFSAAAKRDTFATERVAVDFDASTGRMKLVSLRVSNPANFDAGSEQWMDDPLAPNVTLEGVRLVSGMAGAMDLDTRKFRMEFAGAGAAQGRAGVALLFSDEEAGQRWVVRLSPSATRAEVLPGQNVKSLQTGDPDAIDLDATGMRDDPW
jgi:prepilin-type N-terminal cleavage/methylation domain-containing protein